MSRVFRTEAPSKTRKRILSQLAVAFQRLSAEQVGQNERQDILAFFLLALEELDRLVEQTAASWEKRDYWLKADRFRQEWKWVPTARDDLHRALAAGNWQAAHSLVESLEAHLPEAALRSHKHPWRGAWQGLKTRGDRRGQA